MNKRKKSNHKYDFINNLLTNNLFYNDSKKYNINFLSNKNHLYNKYVNDTNCDQIILMDNHIYFDAVINKETIDKLIEYINSCSSFDTIFLHINTKGGYLCDLITFIEFKKKTNIEIVSIIEKECIDCGIIMASICHYRIIKKNAICKLTSYKHQLNSSENNFPHYWSYFKQCNYNLDNINEFKNVLYNLFCNVIDSKITNEKLNNYLSKNNVWNCKKYKKLGLVDDII